MAPFNDVNFAPSPGMSFGVTFLKRGRSKRDRFLRALGPGIGINVSFMNFDDPAFDLAANKFVNTSGQTVQIGTGIIGSLFDNKLQFSYGWNLNANRSGTPAAAGAEAVLERRRQYFGIGFGFLEVAKELGKFLK